MAKQKKKMGRRPWKPTEKQKEMAVQMASVFASDRAIYTALNISRETFINYKDRDPDFADLLANSRIKTVTVASAAMVSLALEKKQFPALQFLLKSKGGWNDNGEEALLPEDRKFTLELLD